ERALPPELVQQQVARDRGQPGDGAVRHALAPPLADRAQPCLLGDIFGQGTVAVAVARDVAVQPVDRVPVDDSDLLFAHESSHAVPRRGGLTTRHTRPEEPTLRLPGRRPAAKLSGVPVTVPVCSGSSYAKRHWRRTVAGSTHHIRRGSR